MTAPVWEPGHLYLTGSIVQPITQPVASPASITNPTFESGDTGWTKGTGWSVVNEGDAFSGTWTGKMVANASGDTLENTPYVAVTPGTSITASCKVNQGASAQGQAGAKVTLRWYDSGNVFLSENYGNTIDSGSGSAFQTSTVTATAPTNAAYVRVGAFAWCKTNNPLRVDDFSWNYVAPPVQVGLVYKAVQPDPGISAATEPTWPTTNGVTVVDNTVTWEAILATQVTWQASPLLVSGATEPDWPTTPGASVSDGTVVWTCISRRVEDTKCPNTKVVEIVAGKVFAVDGDIVRYSATANPLDWSSADDAGYLPTGLQSANANDAAVLKQYRGNLCAWNASSFQMWQVDPDPAAMAILDQMEGIGSTQYRAAQPVGDELFFLSQLGVRTVGIAVASDNLANGDVGTPIDSLIQAAVTSSNVGIATYYPSAGQYWLGFKDYTLVALSLTGNVPDGYVGDQVNYQYVAAGGVAPYTISLYSGTLPAGTSLSDSGLLTGAYTTVNSYTFRLKCEDAVGTVVYLDDTVVVGQTYQLLAFTNLGQILKSTDDFASFTSKYSATSDNWISVAVGPNRNICAVSSTGAASIVTEDDGETWTRYATNITTVPGAKNDLCYSETYSLYFFCNANGFTPTDAGHVWTSADGKSTWSEVTPSGMKGALSVWESGGTVLVATIAGWWRSTNGTTFTSIGSTAFSSIRWSNYHGCWFATRNSGGSYLYKSTDDGLTFVAVNSAAPTQPSSLAINGDGVIVIGGGGSPTYEISRSTDVGVSFTGAYNGIIPVAAPCALSAYGARVFAGSSAARAVIYSTNSATSFTLSGTIGTTGTTVNAVLALGPVRP